MRTAVILKRAAYKKETKTYIYAPRTYAVW